MKENNLIKTILLIHGYNGAPKIFDYFASELEKRGYKVIIPNFPTREQITLAGYFKIFDDYQNEFSQKPIVIAHSIGNEMTLKYICSKGYELSVFISLAGFSRPFTVEGRDDLNNVLAPISLSEEEKNRCVELIEKRFSIYGDNDHLVPLSLLQSFCDDIQSKSQMISGIGHMGSKSGLTELPQVIEIIDSLS